MKTLFLDIFSGISGDMFLGAMIDLGVDRHALERELKKLNLEGYHLHVSRQQRGSISGTKFDVHVQDHDHPHHGHEEEGGHNHNHGHEHAGHQDHHHQDAHAHGHEGGGGHGHGHKHDHGHGGHHHHTHGHEDEPGQGHEHEHEHGHGHGRTFAGIRALILASDLSDWVKEKAVAVFQRVAVAEGRIHGQPSEDVHFHEVGAVDSIVDIVGACAALELLGRPTVWAGPVLEGMGTVRCAHGQFPLPAPATLEILAARGVKLEQCEEPHELITPTGAALLAEFAESFGPMGPLEIAAVGYGLGTRENLTRPNVLRAVLGRSDEVQAHDWDIDTVTVIETNLDDITAEILGGFVEKAFGAGALDVFHTPIQMKKNRPGVLLTVLCHGEQADRMTELILTETSAFGVRRHSCDRRKLKREEMEVQTPFGDVVVKVGRLDGRVVQVSPEYESCRRASNEAGVPLKQVYEAVFKAVEP